MTAALRTAPSAVAPAVPAHRPRVVVRPAPRREPPFDDELPEPTLLHGGQEQRLPFGVEPAPRAWVPRAARSPAGPYRLPDPAAWSHRLLIGLIETSAGRRPLAQLSGMLSQSVNRGLCDSFERAARQGAAHWLHRASVRSVRAAEPVDGVAEVCATVDIGRRVRALAFRLEECHGRWRCVRLQLG
jgi:hypothetical protein